jgi:hypothetical protein
MLLSNPQWERRLLHFLALSGVGRIMDTGKGEEETRTERMAGWVVWEHGDIEPD